MPEPLPLRCYIQGDGTLYFEDHFGKPASEGQIAAYKKSYRTELLGQVQQKCDEINGQVEAIRTLHHATPSCLVRPSIESVPFTQSPPVEPTKQRLGFFAGLFAKNRARVEAAHAAALKDHEREMSNWATRKVAHEAAQERMQKALARAAAGEPDAMETYFEERLSAVDWPRETIVSFDIKHQAKKLFLDVDLPELDDMPTRTAEMPLRAFRLKVKRLPEAELQRLYAEHVHGILFRLVGEAFAALPTIETVIASGYTQRLDKGTGRMRDEYVLSVSVERSRWRQIEFNRLRDIDVVEALSRHNLKRQMDYSNHLNAIEPFAV